MKHFLATYLGSASAGGKAAQAETDKGRSRAGMEAWGQWAMEHADAIVDRGSPIGTTKRIGPEGISGTVNRIAAYVIVRAESHDAAARMFEGHPHFSLFPGDSVEVMECLPMPELKQ